MTDLDGIESTSWEMHGIERKEGGSEFVALVCDESIGVDDMPMLSRMLYIKETFRSVDVGLPIDRFSTNQNCSHVRSEIQLDDRTYHCGECLDQGHTDWVNWTLSFFKPEL